MMVAINHIIIITNYNLKNSQSFSPPIYRDVILQQVSNYLKLIFILYPKIGNRY